MSSLPSLSDINVYDSLDERTAVKHFYGKNLQQAEALFRENFLRYHEDLMWMGPRAFCFYVEAAIRYLLSDSADGDEDAIPSFYGVIEFRLTHDDREVMTVMPKLSAAVSGILQRWERYACQPQVSAELAESYRGLERRLIET